MKLFRTTSEVERAKDIQETQKALQSFEDMLEEIRQIIGNRRTILKNADKKLQEFQDTMYAIIMEENYPTKKFYRPGKPGDEPEKLWVLH